MGFYIDMINVGEGDSFLLTLDTPERGEVFVLIDGGLPDQGEVVSKYVRDFANNELRLVIATHLDKDHIGGLISVAQSAIINELVINVPAAFQSSWFGKRSTLGPYKQTQRFSKFVDAVELADDLLKAMQKYQPTAKIGGAVTGRSWVCGDVRLRVLNPTPARLTAAWEDSGLLEEIKRRQAQAAQVRNALTALPSSLPAPPGPN
jgi:beta-lactamase superfamily II metal-dependent hydrolase